MSFEQITTNDSKTPNKSGSQYRHRSIASIMIISVVEEEIFLMKIGVSKAREMEEKHL